MAKIKTGIILVLFKIRSSEKFNHNIWLYKTKKPQYIVVFLALPPGVEPEIAP